MKQQFKKNPIIDVKMGAIGALFLGVVVFLVNAPHGWELALIAASKQAMYTFFIGGVMTRITEHLAVNIKNQRLAIQIAVAIPSILTSALTLGMHSLKGTPEPFISTIPTFLFAPLGFFIWAARKRKQLVS